MKKPFIDQKVKDAFKMVVKLPGQSLKNVFTKSNSITKNLKPTVAEKAKYNLK